MFKRLVILFLTACISLIAVAELNNDDPHYAPQSLVCIINSSNHAIDCNLNDPYLRLSSYQGTKGGGTYHLVYGKTMEGENSPFYWYQNANGAYLVVTAGYYIITADFHVPGSRWALQNDGTYKCYLSAGACPFTHTPYIKTN